MDKKSKTKRHVTANLMYKIISSVTFIVIIAIGGYFGMEYTTPSDFEPSESATISNTPDFSVFKSEKPTPTPKPSETPIVTATPKPSKTPTKTVKPTPTLKPSETPIVTATPKPSKTPTKTVKPTPTLKPSETPNATATPKPSKTPTKTVKPMPTLKPSETPNATATPKPSKTPTKTVKPTPTLKPSETPTVTATPKPSKTPTETVKPTPTLKSSETPNATVTPKPSKTPTETVEPTPTPKPSETPIVTPTPKPSETPIVTATPKPSKTPTVTATPKPSKTPTETVNPTPTPKPSETPIVTATPKPSKTPTETVEPTPTPKPSETPTVTATPQPSEGPVTKAVDVEIRFISSGGDAVLITNGDSNVLIDTGKNRTDVYEYLTEHEIVQLDCIILTNTETCHTGGLDKILDGISVNKVILPKIEDKYITKALLRTLKKHSDLAEYIELSDVGKKYEFALGTFEILTPLCISAADNLKSYSMAIKFEYYDTAIMFMSDITSENETLLLQQGKDLSADIIKISNHATDGYTSDELIKYVSPKFAVIMPLVDGNGIICNQIQSTTEILKNNDVGYVSTETNDVIFVTNGAEIISKSDT